MKLPFATLGLRRWMLALSALLLWQTGYAGHHSGMPQTSGKALGVNVSEVPLQALAAVDLDYGIRVVGVVPGSPAAAAGLQKDDIIIELGGKPVYSVRNLQWLVRQAPDGTSVPIKLRRQDKLETVSVTLPPAQPPVVTGMGYPGTGHPGMGHHPGMAKRPYVSGAYLGVQFQPMTQQLRSAFGAPDDKGVLVVSVAEDGPADEAGLAVSDAIVRMDRKAITGVQDIYRVLAYFDPGDQIEVEVIRDKSSQTLTARLGAVPTSMSHLSPHAHPYMHPPHARP